MAAPGPARGAAPEAVSPGSATRFSTIESGCPTFSWGRVEGASAYELVAYETPEPAPRAGGEEGEPALRVSLPGTASSWTPPLERCLAPGRRYAWAVRALGSDGGGQRRWSVPKLFEVAPAPSAEEVTRALAIIRSGRSRPEPSVVRPTRMPASPSEPSRAEPGAAATSGPEPAPASRGPLPLAVSPADAVGLHAEPGETTGVVFGLHGLSKSTGAGSAGVVGQSTAGAGATAGILGQVASPGGTAGVFDNAAGGPILRGLSGGVEVFSVAGTGAVSAVGFAGDGSGLTGVDADTLGGNDSSAFAAAAHLHDDRYFTETEMTTGGSGAGVHWDKLAGVPAGFADGTDADTTYSSGPGLVLSGTQFSLRAFPRAPRDNIRTTLESAGLSGAWTSLTHGADGLGLISYKSDPGIGDLKVAHCENAECSAAAISTLDTNTVGSTSVTIGADGLPLIAYVDASGNLKVAHCNDEACSAAGASTLGNSVAAYPSITIGSDGLGLISFLHVNSQALRVAHCSNAACTTATVSTLDGVVDDVGWYTSITAGADGLGLISYYDVSNEDLKVAACDDALCSSAIVTTLDSAGTVGEYTSIALGADGLGLIIYWDRTGAQLMAAHCDDLDCTSATLSALVSLASNPGRQTSVTIGPDNLALISFADSGPKVAHCAQLECTSVNVSAISTDPGGSDTSISVGVDGLPLVSYYRLPGNDLNIAHCGSPICVPYFRHR